MVSLLTFRDSTQSTASNRIKLYVNGVQETSFATETYHHKIMILDCIKYNKILW